MRILSHPSARGSYSYYTSEWSPADVRDFLTEVGIQQGEPVGIYSAPKNTLTVEYWQHHVQAIKDCGGKPVIVVFAEWYLNPEKGADFQERLGVEVISREEWIVRGGEAFG